MRGYACFLLLLPVLGNAQHFIRGRVLEAVSRSPLEHVSIGSRPPGVFTITRHDGSFTLEVPGDKRVDSLEFALLGHASEVRSVASLIGQPEVLLRVDAHELLAAEVMGEGREERRLGNRSHHLLFNYLLEEDRPNDHIEVAQVIDLGPSPVPITAVNLFVSHTPMDSATFRIGFLAYDGERPTGPLLQRPLIRRTAMTEGWMHLDLQNEHIRLQDLVVVTVELLPGTDSALRRVAVGIRLGGGMPAFDRRSGGGEWVRMPHRYSIHVTAMVPKGRSIEPVEDPDPFQGSVDLRLWSPVVKDSFAIAFGLPEHYDPARPGGYATLYLLDANVYFNDVLDEMRDLARGGRISPMIVVGVGYRDAGALDSLRVRDDLLVRADGLPGSGGGGHFLSFLENELAPLVRQWFPCDTTHCAIMGHSLAGHLVLFAFVERELHGRSPFNAFVAASPSVDVADSALPKALEGLASEDPTPYCPVFISHGRDEDDEAMRISVERLRRYVSNGVVERHYPGADHMGTALPSFRDGPLMLWGRE